MFCNKCGNEIAEGVNFCTKCGTPIDEAAQTVNTQANTVVEQAIPPVMTNADNMAIFDRKSASKKMYLKNYAPQNIKQINLVRIILSYICVAMLVLNLFLSITMPIFDMPIVQIASDSTSREMDDEFYDLADEFNANISDSEKQKFEDEFGIDADKFIKDFEKFIETPSVLNSLSVASKYEDVLEDEVDSDDGLDIFGLFLGIILIFFAPGFLFALFGVIFAKQGLIITGHIFTLIFTMLFAGIVPTIITFALITALSVVLSMVNRGYRKFKKSQAF